MGIQSKIAAFVRWVLTWPVLVVLALNIENATSDAGYATVINQHWKEAVPMLKDVYAFATSGWILYPALLFAGATIYEWVRYTSNKMEADGSAYHRWLVRQQAETIAYAFCKNGLYRKMTKANELEIFNNRMRRLGMPTVPPDFAGNEGDHSVFGAYLSLVAKGQFDHAKRFLAHSNLVGDSERQLPEGTGSETP